MNLVGHFIVFFGGMLFVCCTIGMWMMLVTQCEIAPIVAFAMGAPIVAWALNQYHFGDKWKAFAVVGVGAALFILGMVIDSRTDKTGPKQ